MFGIAAFFVHWNSGTRQNLQINFSSVPILNGNIFPVQVLLFILFSYFFSYVHIEMAAAKTFDRDAREGEKYERLAVQYFEQGEVEFSSGEFSAYDFIINGKLKVEVKSDYIATRTGNIAIEYKCNGKKSGIYSSEADYYLYFVIGEPDRVFKIPTQELIALAEEKGRKISGGDGGKSRMYLIKIKEFEKWEVEACHNKPEEETRNFEPAPLTFPFGKYKGQSVEYMANTQDGYRYLSWVRGQPWFDKFEDLAAAIDELIN
jgi:hypothetical protein